MENKNKNHDHSNCNHKHDHKHNHSHDHNHSNDHCECTECSEQSSVISAKCCGTTKKTTCSSDLESEEPREHHHHHHKDGIWNKFCIFMGWREDHDHDHDHGHHGHDHEHTFEPKVWILVLATILGLLALYKMLMGLFFDNGPILDLLSNDHVEFTLGLIGFFTMGIAFLIGSYITLSKKEIAEDTLVALATTSAFAYSVLVYIINPIFDLSLPYFFYEMIEILWLIYLGRFIEEWLTSKVGREMSALEDLKPKSATIIRDGTELEVPANKIKVGDIVVVKPGQLIPIDGKVVEGNTTVDESSLTGESLPINKEKGSQVFGGTISASGLIKIEATKILNESFISQIINSVGEAMRTKPQSQRIADKIAKYLIPSVLVIAIFTFFVTGIVFSFINVPGPFMNMANTSSGWIYAFYIFITVLVIACPCSFAMITPMSVLVANSASKKEGVIFSSNTLFEAIKAVDVICFDKTGTLTEGKFKVVSSTIDKDRLTEVISIEKASNHPLALSIVDHYKDVETKDVKVEEVIGKGVKSSSIMIGSLNWLNEFIPEYKEEESIIEKRKNGSAFIYAFNKEKVVGYIELVDQIKSTTLETLSQIRKMGIDVVMITGDQKDTAINIASQLGINSDNVYYEVSPQNKSDIIEELQAKGKVVSFVGDGINDSVALTRADIGIAMGEGSDAAIQAADIVLNGNDLSLVSYSIWLSRKTLSTIKRGFGIAIAYNIVMVPFAATGILGLTGAGPALAALSMVFNDSVAMINAMTLSSGTKSSFDKKNK